ncbi:hypothetical protein, partial [Aquimarina sp. Aq78]
MKQELIKIYRDISRGKLTKKEALDKIKTIKLQKQDKATATGVLLANSVWEPISLDILSKDQIEYTQQHIILCEISGVEEKEIKALLPDCKILSLQSDDQQSIADRYERYAISCFDYIRNILSNKPQGKIHIQIVIG